MLEVLFSVFAILGAMIGVGFISGKEIAVYFCPTINNPIYLLLFSFCNFFLLLASFYIKERYSSIKELNKSNFGKLDKFFNIVFFIAYFLFASSMLAALSKVFCKSFFFYILSVFLCFFHQFNKNKPFKLFNVLSVLIAVAFALLIALNKFDRNFNYLIDYDFNFLTSIRIILYSSINYLLVFSNVFVLKQGGKYKNLIVSLIVTFVLSFLVFIIGNSVASMNLYAESFPMLILSNYLRYGGLVFVSMLWCGILSTLSSCLSSMLIVLENKKESSIDYALKLLSLLVLSNIFSLIGFDYIIEYGYMILGIFAFVYFILIFIILPSFRKFFLKQSNSKIH